MTSRTKTTPGNRWPSAPRCLATLAGVAVLAGCTITSTREAPVADRSTTPPVQPAAPPPSAAVKPAPPRIAGVDGTYLVQPGDTLHAIAAAFGRDVKDLARWNNIDDPARILVGQTLRVVPPRTEAAAVLPVAPAGAASTKPLDGSAAPAAPAEPAAAPGPVAAIPEAKPSSPPPASDWIWPVNGPVIENFDKKRRKNGISIAGKEGDPVVASADGEVIYSGNSLRGYGNLIILRHKGGFVTAYAHNKQILVQQGQTVKRGQRIAEVGRTETTEPKLHFELRREGQAVDPLAYLPPR